MKPFDAAYYLNAVKSAETVLLKGKITKIIGLVIESDGPSINLGELCYIYPRTEAPPLPAEVVGFRENRVLLMPLGEMQGIGPGSEVVSSRNLLRVKVGRCLLGRILDGLGNPIDGKGPLTAETEYPIQSAPPAALSRRRICEPVSVGIRAVDGLMTLGKGQRMAILAGSGVGKSTMMGMIARNTSADINVIALIGERGREVLDFIERDLGEEGLKKSVVVVSTSDQPALLRIKGANTATAVAEYFRDQGLDVMLMMDSLTRVAMAQREVGLTIGEPPATRGYPPSVFAMMPKLLERSGTGEKGSITGLYAVLVDGDDMNEPIADNVRSIVDGHVVLSRRLATQNHYPPIDILSSLSRVMNEVVNSEHLKSAQRLRSLQATYQEAEDLINIGAYASGSNPEIDRAIEKNPGIREFLRQGVMERVDFDDTVARLKKLVQ
ncbi:MAG: flagellar protein export ATPase FliI [Negativicutes bacterium]